MLVRLGIWWRIWVVASVIYGAIVAVFTWNTYPRVENISYDKNQFKSLSDQTLLILAGRVQPQVPTGAPGFHSGPITLEMPNGHTFEVPGTTTPEQAQEIAKDYVGVLNSIANERRPSAVINAFLTWLIPSLVVLALISAVHWIYRGFRRGST